MTALERRRVDLNPRPSRQPAPAWHASTLVATRPGMAGMGRHRRRRPETSWWYIAAALTEAHYRTLVRLAVAAIACLWVASAWLLAPADLEAGITVGALVVLMLIYDAWVVGQVPADRDGYAPLRAYARGGDL